MNNQSERIPASDQYLRSLGRATYNFAYLEWGIVWLTETIEPSFLQDVPFLTAGQIADRFERALKGIKEPEPDQTRLEILAAQFKGLVEDRNRLIHGNPHTAFGGEQRLLYSGKHGRKDWTIELMVDFADRVATASVEASQLLHGGRYAVYKSAYQIDSY